MHLETDTRSRILATAHERFHGRSDADVGIQEICAGAKVQKGSFYHHVPSKHALDMAVIDDMAEDWAHGFVAETFGPNLPPLERLDYLIDAAYYWQKAAAQLGDRGVVSPDRRAPVRRPWRPIPGGPASGAYRGDG